MTEYYYEYIPLDLSNIENEEYKTYFNIKDTTLNLTIRKPKVSNYYYVDVLDQSLSPIIKGVRLQPFMNIMRGIKDDRYPNIFITPIPVNNNGLYENLEYPTLTRDFQLIITDRDYVEEEEE